MSNKKYVDELENFCWGTYKGESVKDVFEEDPEYLEFALENFDLSRDERELIESFMPKIEKDKNDE